MICFGIKTDQKVKEKVTCGSHLKKKKNHLISYDKEMRERGRAFLFFILFLFLLFSHFSLRFTEIGPSEFVGARSKVMYSTRATHGNQKHGISPSF